MSAGVRNSLGHSAATPAEKLAGMKLGHFSGFLKRSWRANDWLWGRLDGVEHVLRCLVDRDYVRTARERRGDEVIHELAALAFPDEDAAEVLDSWRRTKAVLIYRRTGNLRAVQLLLGHSKIESTVRYLGIEVDDAIEIAEKIDI